MKKQPKSFRFVQADDLSSVNFYAGYCDICGKGYTEDELKEKSVEEILNEHKQCLRRAKNGRGNYKGEDNV